MLGRTMALAFILWSFAVLAPAAEPTLLHVNTFPLGPLAAVLCGVDRGLLRQART